MSRIHYKILITILVLAFSIAALAQTGTTGQVMGTVIDPSSAVVSGAKVELSGGAGVKRETITNSAGEYTFSLVPPGTYAVSVSSQNFRKTELKNVVVRITETTRLNLPLALLGAAENVTVTAEAPLLQTTSPANGRVVDSETISELPLATRNFTQIL